MEPQELTPEIVELTPLEIFPETPDIINLQPVNVPVPQKPIAPSRPSVPKPTAGEKSTLRRPTITNRRPSAPVAKLNTTTIKKGAEGTFSQESVKTQPSAQQSTIRAPPPVAPRRHHPNSHPDQSGLSPREPLDRPSSSGLNIKGSQETHGKAASSDDGSGEGSPKRKLANSGDISAYTTMRPSKHGAAREQILTADLHMNEAPSTTESFSSSFSSSVPTPPPKPYHEIFGNQVEEEITHDILHTPTSSDQSMSSSWASSSEIPLEIIVATFTVPDIESFMEIPRPALMEHVPKTKLQACFKVQLTQFEKHRKEFLKKLIETENLYQKEISDERKTLMIKKEESQHSKRTSLSTINKKTEKEVSSTEKKMEEQVKLAMKKEEESKKLLSHENQKKNKLTMAENKAKLKALKKTTGKAELKTMKNEMEFSIQFNDQAFQNSTACSTITKEHKEKWRGIVTVHNMRIESLWPELEEIISANLKEEKVNAESMRQSIAARFDSAKKKVHLINDFWQERCQRERANLEERIAIECEMHMKALEIEMKQKAKSEFSDKTLAKKCARRTINQLASADQTLLNVFEQEILAWSKQKEEELSHYHAAERSVLKIKVVAKEKFALNAIENRIIAHANTEAIKLRNIIKDEWNLLQSRITGDIEGAKFKERLEGWMEEEKIYIEGFNTALSELLKAQEQEAMNAFQSARSAGGFRSQFERDHILLIENTCSNADKARLEAVQQMKEEFSGRFEDAFKQMEIYMSDLKTRVESFIEVELTETDRFCEEMRESVDVLVPKPEN